MQHTTITIKFRTEHNPGTPDHLNQVARNYLRGKGIIMDVNNEVII